MIEIVNAQNLEEYESFIAAHKKGHFMQSVLWSRVKTDWKWEAFLLRDAESGKIYGSCALLFRKMPGLPYTIAYAPRGPVCDISNKAVLAEILEGTKELAKKHKSVVLKIDPDVLSSDTVFQSDMQELGFSLLKGGAEFDMTQPKYVFRLALEGRNIDELIDSFESKTRYNLRLAARKGVTVEISGEEGLTAFSDIMVVTGVRDNFLTRPKAYFQKILDQFGEHARLYIAKFEGKAIAGTLAIYYGDKVWYLYGASSNEYRNVMPNYLLQTEMIKWAAEKNCRIYDFRGVAGILAEDHPMYGLYRFKKGFNGDFTEFCGEFEYVFNKPVHFAFTNAMKIYKKARKGILGRKNKKTAKSIDN